MSGIVYHSLVSKYKGDITKKSGLITSEIDGNFQALEGNAIKEVKIKNGFLSVSLLNGNCYSVELPYAEYYTKEEVNKLVSEIINAVPSETTKGMVKVDGTTIVADSNGVISVKKLPPSYTPAVNAFRWSFLFTQEKDYDEVDNGYVLYLPFIAQEINQNITIDWGDGLYTDIPVGTQLEGYLKHVYDSHGLKVVTITCDNEVVGAENTMPMMATALNSDVYEKLYAKQNVSGGENVPLYANGYTTTAHMKGVVIAANGNAGAFVGLSYSITNISGITGGQLGRSSNNLYRCLRFQKSELIYNDVFYNVLELRNTRAVTWYAYTAKSNKVLRKIATFSSRSRVVFSLPDIADDEYYIITVYENLNTTGGESSYVNAYYTDDFVEDAFLYKEVDDSFSGYNGEVVTEIADLTTTDALNADIPAALVDCTTAKNNGYIYLSLDMNGFNGGTLEVFNCNYTNSQYVISGDGLQYNLTTNRVINIPITTNYILLRYVGSEQSVPYMVYGVRQFKNTISGRKAAWKGALISIDTPLLRMMGNNTHQTTLNGMFKGCVKLQYFPSSLLRNIGVDLTDAIGEPALGSLFMDSGLTEYPSNFLNASYFPNYHVSSVAHMFDGTKLNTLNPLGDGVSKIFLDFSYMFANTPLKYLREDLFDGILDDENNLLLSYNFSHTFYHTDILSTNRVFTKLFLLNYYVSLVGSMTPISRYDFSYTFAECYNLEIKVSDFVTDINSVIAAQYYDVSDNTILHPDGVTAGLYTEDIAQVFYNTYARDEYNMAATQRTQEDEWGADSSLLPTIRVPNLWEIATNIPASYVGTYSGNGNNSMTIYGYSDLASNHSEFIDN